MTISLPAWLPGAEVRRAAPLRVARQGVAYSEDALVRCTASRLRAERGIHALAEVPIMGRVADLAFMHDGDLVTMEFKISNWRRAIRQARDHRLAADFAYICMPERQLTGALLSALEANGVGLAFCTPVGAHPFEVIVKAPRSVDTWSTARSVLCRYIAAHTDDWSIAQAPIAPWTAQHLQA
jgi:hypothetical protein